MRLDHAEDLAKFIEELKRNRQGIAFGGILLLKWFSVFYGRAAVPTFK
jgi:hypothetical protein